MKADDYVTEVDRLQSKPSSLTGQAFPDHRQFMRRNSGFQPGQGDGDMSGLSIRWTASTNLSVRAAVAVSIACRIKGKIEISVVWIRPAGRVLLPAVGRALR